MLVWRPRLRPTSRSRWVCDHCIAELTGRPAQNSQRRWITRNHIRKLMTAEEEWNLRKQDIESGKKKSMLDLLEERGYVNQIVGSRDEVNNLLNARRVGVYVGVDPTARSLHVGHMMPFMALGWMYIHGYSANYLMGGYTASIGDPIGRLTGRKAQMTSERTANAAAMFQQLKKLSASIEQHAEKKGYQREWAWRRSVKNNYAWWQKLSMKDFMKVMGAGTRIGPMLGRDTVKNRLESGEGMSFAEFTYPLVQAWDWWELYQQGVQIQIGGADQFGNILAGAEAVKYMSLNDAAYVAEKNATKLIEPTPGSDDPMGFTVPLLTTSSGEKFGKSAGNAVWLDPDLTSSFDLYQFFLRSADADVEKYLKLFTFLSLPEITQIMNEQNQDPSKRIAQHTLAYEFVDLIHGTQAAKQAQTQHQTMFDRQGMTVSNLYSRLQSSPSPSSSSSSSSTSTNPSSSSQSDFRPADINPSLNKHAPPLDMHTGGAVSIKLPQSLIIHQPLSRILWSAGLCASRSEGQRLINNRGVYIGGRRQKSHDPRKPANIPLSSDGDLIDYAPAEDPKWSTGVSPFVIDDRLLILRTGKWRVKIIEIVSDDEFEALGLDCPGWKEGEEQKELNELDVYGEEKYRVEKLVADQERKLKREKEERRLKRVQEWNRRQMG